MHLENIVFDAVDPQALGGHWEAVLGTERLTDEPDIVETRLAVPGGPVLDLCFQPVAEEPAGAPRLHLHVEDGVLTELRLESADPERDTAFWGWLTGWVGGGPHELRHDSGTGPALVLVEERGPTRGKSPRHLDVRLGPGEDADRVAAGIARRGGSELHPGWGDLAWRVYRDPSGNIFCVLPPSPDQAEAVVPDGAVD